MTEHSCKEKSPSLLKKLKSPLSLSMLEPGIVLVNVETRETRSFLEPLPGYQNHQNYHQHHNHLHRSGEMMDGLSYDDLKSLLFLVLGLIS